MRILLAEDDPHVAVIMQLCLERIGGHSVVVKGDGESALQAVLQAAAQVSGQVSGQEPFDLILLDGMMPKMSGLQVATELKSSIASRTPIIFLSAKSDEIAGFLALGRGYIAKPFDPQTICSCIDDILKSKGAVAG